jgi:pSer/pThr/pTyr-binding forkhead associated (FHA) protein
MGQRKLTLTIVDGELAGTRFFLPEDRKISIGRNPKADIRIPSKTISSLHAVVEHRGGEIYLNDPGSSNGTFIEGKRVTEFKLLPGQSFRLADVRFMVDWTDFDDSDQFTDTLELHVPISMKETDVEIPTLPDTKLKETVKNGQFRAPTVRLPTPPEGTSWKDHIEKKAGESGSEPPSSDSDEFDRVFMDIPLVQDKDKEREAEDKKKAEDGKKDDEAKEKMIGDDKKKEDK